MHIVTYVKNMSPSNSNDLDSPIIYIYIPGFNPRSRHTKDFLNGT